MVDLVTMVGTKKVIDLFAESTWISKMKMISACLPLKVSDLFADSTWVLKMKRLSTCLPN